MRYISTSYLPSNSFHLAALSAVIGDVLLHEEVPFEDVQRDDEDEAMETDTSPRTQTIVEKFMRCDRSLWKG